jgi:hypothetical protein
MTPKEKAKKLYNQFFDYADSNYGANRFEQNWHGNVLAGERKVRKKSAKQCALIAVDEMIIQNGELFLNGLDGNYYRKKNAFLFEVKLELENL